MIQDLEKFSETFGKFARVTVLRFESERNGVWPNTGRAFFLLVAGSSETKKAESASIAIR